MTRVWNGAPSPKRRLANRKIGLRLLVGRPGLRLQTPWTESAYQRRCRRGNVATQFATKASLPFAMAPADAIEPQGGQLGPGRQGNCAWSIVYRGQIQRQAYSQSYFHPTSSRGLRSGWNRSSAYPTGPRRSGRYLPPQCIRVQGLRWEPVAPSGPTARRLSLVVCSEIPDSFDAHQTYHP